MNEDTRPIKKVPRRILWSIYALGAIVPLIGFTYFTFPYGVIKEFLIQKLSSAFIEQNIPLRVKIGQLSPYWVTGVELKNLSLYQVSDTPEEIAFPKVTARLNVTPLFINQISLSSSLQQKEGFLDLKVSLPMIQTLFKGAASPYIDAQIDNFGVEGFFKQVFGYIRTKNDPAFLLLAPLLGKSSLGGFLFGNVNLNGDKGDFHLSLKKGFLDINDATLKIPKQDFKKFTADLSLNGPKLVFEPPLEISSQDLDINVSGSMEGSFLALNLKLEMRGEIEKNLGFLLPNLMGCPPMQNGILNVKLTGKPGGLACTL
jgi:type II secretion system protein N